jgi:hypothetical protein
VLSTRENIGTRKIFTHNLWLVVTSSEKQCKDRYTIGSSLGGLVGLLCWKTSVSVEVELCLLDCCKRRTEKEEVAVS